MLGRIKEISKSKILKQWIWFRIFNPLDKANPPCFFSKPPYLDSLNYKAFDSKCPLTLPLYKGQENCSEWDSDFYLNKNKDLYKDEEEFLSGYRFKWVHNLIASNVVVDDILKLITQIYEREIEFVDNSYTTAERLSNIGLFLAKSNLSIKDIKKLSSYIENDVNQIINNFEYHGEGYTGNHLLNNARGLLWGSYLLESRSLAELGYSILINEIDRVVKEDGVLREGSTHYQFLVTRNVFESYLILNGFGDFFIEDLKVKIIEMAKTCLFFKVDFNTIPYFGDISPDYDPKWFFDIPEMCLNYFALDSGELRKATGLACYYVDSVSIDLENYKFNNRREYTRLDSGETSLFFKFNDGGAPILAGHAHCDTGAPVVFYKKKPVLIDRGRFNYTPDSNSYLKSSSHNCIIINNVEPEEMRRGAFGERFISWRFGESASLIENTKSKASLEINNYSFMGINVKRDYEVLSSGSIVLKFKVFGSGKYKVEVPLNLGPDYNPDILEFSSPGSIEVRKVSFSHNYGISKEATSVVWSDEVSLPFELSVVVNPIS